MAPTSSVLQRILLLFLSVSTAVDSYKYKPRQVRCERIAIPLCADMRYNFTRMPNLLGHVTQQEAASQVHEFIPLVQVGCSRLLKFFLCAVYAPMCTEQVEEVLVILPCRSMCEEVRSRCEPILQRFNFHWPTSLDCDSLPRQSTREDLCIEPPGEHDSFPGDDRELDVDSDLLDHPAGRQAPTNIDWMTLFQSLDHSQVHVGADWQHYLDLSHDTTSRGARGHNHNVLCPPRYVAVGAAGDDEYTDTGDVTCVPRCRGDVTVRADDKRFGSAWQIVWSSLSMTSSLVTLLTFIVDSTRFRYPERPVVFVAVCSALYASAYVVRAAAGSDVISCSSRDHAVRSDVRNVWCVVVAVLMYYFGVAGAIWWAVLTVSWYLAAARKWGEEAISSLGRYFHIVSWSLPAVSTTVALALHKVNADEMTGMCLIGAASVVSSRSSGLIEFLVVPMFVCLAVGVGFVAAGFGAVYRIRRALRRDGDNVERLERLMVKMAVFSALYAAPLTCVLGCLLYEKRGAPGWDLRARTAPCSQPNGLDRCPLDESIPAVEVYLIKTFASLMPGIATGVWIWSVKTLRSWQRRMFCCCNSATVRRSSTQGRPRSDRYAAVQTGGRLVRWSTGLKDAPNSTPCPSMSIRNNHCYTIS